jgi:hypothetical protein
VSDEEVLSAIDAAGGRTAKLAMLAIVLRHHRPSGWSISARPAVEAFACKGQSGGQGVISLYLPKITSGSIDDEVRRGSATL